MLYGIREFVTSVWTVLLYVPAIRYGKLDREFGSRCDRGKSLSIARVFRPEPSAINSTGMYEVSWK